LVVAGIFAQIAGGVRVEGEQAKAEADPCGMTNKKTEESKKTADRSIHPSEILR
jgi:hypothetical protein